MNCTKFEQGLARLMAAEETTGVERQRLLEQLTEHAVACADCRDSADLVGLLADGAGEREIVDDPGDEYWTGFEARLRPRLVQPPERSRGRWWAVAAAALFLAVVAGWLLRGSGDARPAPVAEREPIRSEDDATPGAFPPSLVRSLDQASPAEVEDQLAALEAWGPGWGDPGAPIEDTSSDPALSGGSLFPEVDELDAETRRRLLDWLRDQNRGLEGAKG